MDNTKKKLYVINETDSALTVAFALFVDLFVVNNGTQYLQVIIRICASNQSKIMPLADIDLVLVLEYLKPVTQMSEPFISCIYE